MIFKDDRTESQRQTHTIGIVGTDSFMSGWGDASGGTSVACWACSPDQSYTRVFDWVNGRSEMKRVRVVDLRTWRPRNASHVHIYAVESGHPSLK